MTRVRDRWLQAGLTTPDWVLEHLRLSLLRYGFEINNNDGELNAAAVALLLKDLDIHATPEQVSKITADLLVGAQYLDELVLQYGLLSTPKG